MTQTKIRRSNIILLTLVLFVATVIIVLVDFSKEEKQNYNIDIYKAYYIYDTKSSPVNLSYYLLNMEKNTSKEEIVNKITNKLLPNIATDLQVKNITINDDIIELTLNKDITKYEKNSIACLVNSLLQIKNTKNVKFIDEFTKIENIYSNNIGNYYLISPISNKLYTFLYRDLNYKIKYLDNNNQEKYLTIKDIKEHTVTYLLDDYEYQMKVTDDGLYLNNQKIINKIYKTNEQWETYQIKSVKLSEDQSLLIEVINNEDEYQERYLFKQGLGIWEYSRQDKKGKIISSLKYQKKVLNND